jgi:hypothetical protein
MIDETRKLAMARDRKGATPLHDAVLYAQTEVLRHMAQHYPHVLNCLDYVRLQPPPLIFLSEQTYTSALRRRLS